MIDYLSDETHHDKHNLRLDFFLQKNGYWMKGSDGYQSYLDKDQNKLGHSLVGSPLDVPYHSKTFL